MFKNLPLKFNWLNNTAELPLHVNEGLSLLGVSEIVGTKHSPVVMGWAKALGIDNIYVSDELAWCALFAAWILTRGRKHIPLKGWDLLRALRYTAFGTEVPKTGAMLGDVLIFKREGGGHVGIYIAETAKSFFVLGGNQGNKVSIIEIAKDRLHAVRRPVYQNTPTSVKKYHMGSTGILSKNEA